MNLLFNAIADKYCTFEEGKAKMLHLTNFCSDQRNGSIKIVVVVPTLFFCKHRAKDEWERLEKNLKDVKRPSVIGCNE